MLVRAVACYTVYVFDTRYKSPFFQYNLFEHTVSHSHTVTHSVRGETETQTGGGGGLSRDLALIVYATVRL